MSTVHLNPLSFSSLLCLCSFVLGFFSAVAIHQAPGYGWSFISTLHRLPASQFKDLAFPLVQISANAYRYPRLLPLRGWILASLVPPLAPSQGGAHALVYEEDEEEEPSCQHGARRMVLAFRGTQIGDSLDSLADLCADKILWEGFEFSSLPRDCVPFDPPSLDYFSQALNFTKRVLEAYPGRPLLLTGHSLGAGLAILVSAALSESQILPVVGFGPPATQIPMSKRSLHLKALEHRLVYSIVHQWDVVLRTQLAGQVGMLCLYPEELSAACSLCFSRLKSSSSGSDCRFPDACTSSILSACVEDEQMGSFGMQTTALPEPDLDLLWKQQSLQPEFLSGGEDCSECFWETHYLKHLIDIVEIGEKPVCTPAAAGGHEGPLQAINQVLL